MAIDTRAKRQNVAQVGCPLPVSVLPSGSIPVAVRYQIGWSYGGVTGPPPVVTGPFEDLLRLGLQQGSGSSSGVNVNIGGWN